MRAFSYTIAAVLLLAGAYGQATAPSPGSTAPVCTSVANQIAAVSPTYAAAVLQNADAIGLQAYQLAQPQPGISLQKTFLVPEETDFANFYIFLYRRYTASAAATVLKALIALQTLPHVQSAVQLSMTGSFPTNLTGYSLNTTAEMISGPCAPGNQDNIGNEACFATITVPDNNPQSGVGACKQSIIQGISNVLPPPYWNSGDLANVLESSSARAPVYVPPCAMNGKPPCPVRRPGQEVSAANQPCNPLCTISSCCREM